MDYLPVQATSVPCERIFSSSAETDTKRRNRLSPLTMEALQMMKFYLTKSRLTFTAGWETAENDMVDDIPDGDLILSLLKGSQDSLDRVMRAIDVDEN